ncbi:MAG TPA: hypothetical protein VIT67_19575 [Povalibacter sp.]
MAKSYAIVDMGTIRAKSKTQQNGPQGQQFPPLLIVVIQTLREPPT